MGLSSSKSKTTTNQTQNQTTSGTQMPIVPANLRAGLDSMLGRIDQFANVNPSSLVAGPSALQQQAWQQAGNLGGWQGMAQTAAQMAQQAGQSGANLAGGPSTVTGQGYQAPNLSAAQGYTAAQAGGPQSVTAQGYDPSRFGGATIGPAERAQAQSLLTNLPSYMSPYTNDVVDTTLAGFDDQAGRTRAQQAAAAARNGAFGGSRFAIREAQTEADLGRERAATEAGLRDRAFNVGAGLSADDANRRQQASTFNAGQSLQRGIAQAGLDQQTGMFNSDAANQAAAFLAGSRNQAGALNADAANRFALDRAGRTDTASQFGANAQNQMAAIQAELQANAARYGADATNQANAFNAAAQNQTGQFNAGQQDNAQARAFQAAQILGGLSSDAAGNARADVQTQGALGDQQRGVAQSQQLGQLAQLQALTQLYGGLPLDALVGRQITGNSTGTMQGTQVTKQSPSLFNQMMALGNFAAGFI